MPSYRRYQALGLMSGSSLDGLDLAHCEFQWDLNEQRVAQWSILAAETLPFSEMWTARLLHLPQQPALHLAKTHVYFGHYLAELVQRFASTHQLDLRQLDFIASHGHTIFHQPDRRFTLQIGDGAALAALTGCRVICDFRAQDLALGGEGAPLAPLADHYLYPDYCAYLNLGGIANLSARLPDGAWVGFDVCPANQVLNALAQLEGLDYDAQGQLAAQGQCLPDLLEQALQWPYYRQSWPKSLGNEQIRQQVLPLFMAHPASVADRLATAVELIAQQIAAALHRLLPPTSQGRIALSGGGAFNRFLLARLKAQLHGLRPALQLALLPDLHIHFKEAALMALLGVLRLEQLPNAWPSITGATRPSINGAIYEGLYLGV